MDYHGPKLTKYRIAHERDESPIRVPAKAFAEHGRRIDAALAQLEGHHQGMAPSCSQAYQRFRVHS